MVSRFFHKYSHILGNILHKLQHCYDQADIEELFSYGPLRERPKICTDLQIKTMFGFVLTHPPTPKSKHTLVFVIADGHIFGPVHSKPPFMKPVWVLCHLDSECK